MGGSSGVSVPVDLPVFVEIASLGVTGCGLGIGGHVGVSSGSASITEAFRLRSDLLVSRRALVLTLSTHGVVVVSLRLWLGLTRVTANGGGGAVRVSRGVSVPVDFSIFVKIAALGIAGSILRRCLNGRIAGSDKSLVEAFLLGLDRDGASRASVFALNSHTVSCSICCRTLFRIFVIDADNS